MLTKINSIVLLLASFAMVHVVSAQQIKAVESPSIKSDTAITTIAKKNNYIAPVSIPGASCSTPKGAVFCRMEDALYKRLNIHIKLRMGVDDKYSN